MLFFSSRIGIRRRSCDHTWSHRAPHANEDDSGTAYALWHRALSLVVAPHARGIRTCPRKSGNRWRGFPRAFCTCARRRAFLAGRAQRRVLPPLQLHARGDILNGEEDQLVSALFARAKEASRIEQRDLVPDRGKVMLHLE